jgi:uncharacterized membrane protein YphA (DoxX/SURF4 family)
MRSFRRLSTQVGIAACASPVAVTPAAAHVEYTAEGGESVDPLAFLVAVLSEPLNGALLGGAAILAVVVAGAYLRVRPLRRDIAVFRDAVVQYRDLLPWLLRLSFGLPLIGAGFAGYFVSPAVTPPGDLAAVSRLFQIGLGFALLFGFATRAAAFVGLVTYLGVALVRPEVLLALEFVPGFVAIVLLGSGRPSADQVLETVAAAEGTVYGEIDPIHRLAGWFRARVEPSRDYVPTVVRVGLGVTFATLGVAEKLLAPGAALNVVARYDLAQVIPVDPGLWVVGAGLTEFVLGVALVVGLFTRANSLVALLVFTLTLLALPDDPVLAHVTLFGLASALVVTGAGPRSVDRAIERRPS